MLKVARRPLAAPKRGLYIMQGYFVECNEDLLKVFGEKDLVDPIRKFNPKTDTKVDYTNFVYEELLTTDEQRVADEEAAKEGVKAKTAKTKAPWKIPGSGTRKVAPKKVTGKKE